MKRKALIMAMTMVMIVTCFVPVGAEGGLYNNVEESYAAGDTNSDGTYAGTIPSLPNGIAAKAIEFAWPYGTSSTKYSYTGGGNAVAAYATGLQTAYGSRSGWGAAPKAGASCDVFVGTVVRNSYDKNYPRGLDGQFPYLSASDKFTEVNTRKTSKMKDGDIIIYKYKSNGKSGAHTCIYLTINGTGYIANANYKKTYAFITKPNDYTTSRYTEFHVYRACNSCKGALAKGQYSTSVKQLQKFLNWAGFSCGTADGAFGTNTENAVKKFQTAVGLTADGKAGSKTIAAARSYKKGATVSTAKAYSGKWPTSTVNKNKGSKTNIIRWQKFLKWYGYSITTGGTFGQKTIKYTKAFQKKNGLTADGSAGPKTIKKAKSIKK